MDIYSGAQFEKCPSLPKSQDLWKIDSEMDIYMWEIHVRSLLESKSVGLKGKEDWAGGRVELTDATTKASANFIRCSGAKIIQKTVPHAWVLILIQSFVQ